MKEAQRWHFHAPQGRHKPAKWIKFCKQNRIIFDLVYLNLLNLWCLTLKSKRSATLFKLFNT